MDKDVLLAKTAKGFRESSGITRNLSRSLRSLLTEIEAKSTLADLMGRLPDWSESDLRSALGELISERYIHELIQKEPDSVQIHPASYIRPTIFSAASAPLDAGSLEDLDFTNATLSAEVIDQLARKEAEEKARREAEERARREAEEKARREAEEKARKEAEEKARKEAEEKARREAEERARREAEEKARREAEEKARKEAEEKARKEAEEKARREAEERACREAEEKARIEAEEKARREAEEKARKEAEEKTRREAEERAHREAEEKARIEAEEKARREAEEKARKEAEEKTRREAEEKARREAEERARREAEEKARIEAEERARKESEEKSRQAAANMHTERRGREPIKWGKLVELGCVALIAMTIVAVNMMSFESRIPDFERAASAWFQQPVKIKTLRVAFLPHAQWQLEGVAIGSAGQILAPRIIVPTSYAALFDKSNMTLESLQIEAPVIGTEGMGWLLFGRSQAPELHVRQVKATHIKFEVPGMQLPTFDATMDIGDDGNWQKIGIVAMEKKVEMQLTAGNVVRLEMKLNQAALPFGALPVLDDLTAGGTLDRHSLQLDQFNASLSGGSLHGIARMAWGADAILDGDVTARGVDVGRLLAGFMESGRLEGKANFSLPIFSAGKAAATERLTGNFAVERGVLATVDFGRMVRGESGSRTPFNKLTGRVAHRGGETQLRELFLDAGKLTAKGSADLDARRDIRGQFLVSLNLGATRQRVSIALSGPFKEPYKDLKWQ